MSKIKASTISVILPDSESVSCYLDVNGESCNVTLRFDRGSEALICGYPQRWAIHNEDANPYGDSEVTYADLVLADGEELDGYHDLYISAETEIQILSKLKRSIERQFCDFSWMDCRPSIKRQLEILTKIHNAIEALKGGA
jgi:hypothetical protein